MENRSGLRLASRGEAGSREGGTASGRNRSPKQWHHREPDAGGSTHIVPARPEDPSSLERHPEEQGALFGPFKQFRSRHTRLAQPPEGRAQGEAGKVRGAQERGKHRRGERTASDSMARTAASRRPRRAHEGPPSGQNARLGPGLRKKPRA